MNLQDAYNREEFVHFLHTFIPGFTYDVRRVPTKGLQVTGKVEYLGEHPKLDVAVFELTHMASKKNARVQLALDGFRVMKGSGIYKALMVYKSEDSSDWRLSLMTATLAKTEKGKIAQTFSNPRRYSFFLGPQAKINTPYRFLVRESAVKDFEDLQRRFSLEVVNKEFYKGVSSCFTKLVGGKEEPLLKMPSIYSKNQTTMEFGVRLIGRLIFCWFLREKRGQNGTTLMPKELLSSEAATRLSGYYHNVLEPIFFEVLNKEARSRLKKWAREPSSHIPYLNGGLFNPHHDDFYDLHKETLTSRYINTLVIPDEWFRDFFSLLESYNFTIDENTSFDEELSIDPEMLGRIFENLLAEINPETGESARKSTGSFYTPRAIVDYMVDESLFLYLQKKTGIVEEKLRTLISYDLTDDELFSFRDKERKAIIGALETLKLLDPACGSGAFPIGALQKIVFILQRVDPNAKLWFERQIANTGPDLRRVMEREFEHKNYDYIRKLGVIRKNIYGVDIQPIAIEISRLRCFLTLVVDERVDDSLPNRGIEPLPNLDFKFVAANSLIGLKSQRAKAEGLFKDHEGIDKLRAIRERYFTSTNSERQLLQDEFTATQEAMMRRRIKMGDSDDLTEKLSAWEPFSNKPSVWFDPGWMFGVEDCFGIVIGNPPYLESRHSSFSTETKEDLQRAAKARWTEDSEYIAKGADLLVYFYERGLSLIASEGFLVFIVQNSWLDTDYGKKFQQFLLKHTNVKSIVDSDLKHFDGPNINTVITIFSGKVPQDDNEVIFSRFGKSYTELHRLAYSNPLLKEIKWGVLLVASEEVLNLLEVIRKRGKLAESIGLSIGQGLNLSKNLVVDGGITTRFSFLQGKLLSFMNTVDGAPFELTETQHFLVNGTSLNAKELQLLEAQGVEPFDSRSTKKVPPMLILPRGVSRHFCALNPISAYTGSAVEIYDHNVEEETKINVWLFLNSSVAWLLREVSGRKNLGGGLLKAEATDLRSIPIYFDFRALKKIRAIYNRLKDRQAKPTLEEIDTDEHMMIDDIVFEYLGISEDKRKELVAELKQVIQRRSEKAKT